MCLPIRPSRSSSSATRISTSLIRLSSRRGQDLLAELCHGIFAARREGPQIRSVDRPAHAGRRGLESGDRGEGSAHATFSSCLSPRTRPARTTSSTRKSRSSASGRRMPTASISIRCFSTGRPRPGSSKSTTRTFARATPSRSPVCLRANAAGRCPKPPTRSLTSRRRSPSEKPRRRRNKRRFRLRDGVDRGGASWTAGRDRAERCEPSRNRADRPARRPGPRRHQRPARDRLRAAGRARR